MLNVLLTAVPVHPVLLVWEFFKDSVIFVLSPIVSCARPILHFALLVLLDTEPLLMEYVCPVQNQTVKSVPLISFRVKPAHRSME